ncbi:MAG TPA: CoA-binding protein [Methylomirabilota bacterium]|nr:CoA-binding protein [Methylomirabilota bacterium]
MNDERMRALEILDAQEGTGDVPILAGDEPARLLASARRIALVGASPNEARPSHGVMRQLLGWGYEVVPITPKGGEILGQRVYATLEEATKATGHFDIVDVFRRPEHTPDIARSAVATAAGALWLQLGVVSWEAARIAHDGGLPVVMDRCTAIEHRRIALLR